MIDSTYRRIEIELTLRCTRACAQCNRYVNAFPFLPSDHDTDITLDQLSRFCHQVIASGHHYERIAILGGEPLLHPQFPEIIDLLFSQLAYRKRHVNELLIVTNGDLLHGYPLAKIPHLGNLYFRIDHNKVDFVACHTAPIDNHQPQKRCRVPLHCGMGFNTFGFWPCGPSCGISRLFNFPEYRRTDLPSRLSDFGALTPEGNLAICDYCQISARRAWLVSRNPNPSPSFQRVIDNPNPFHPEPF